MIKKVETLEDYTEFVDYFYVIFVKFGFYLDMILWASLQNC